MYNGQNEYVPYKKRTKRLSNGQGTHYRSQPLLCPRLLSFSKVFIIMHEYVNKIICILSYDKIQAFIWYQVFKSRIFSSLDIRNC